jgi:hypothetical protein
VCGNRGVVGPFDSAGQPVLTSGASKALHPRHYPELWTNPKGSSTKDR